MIEFGVLIDRDHIVLIPSIHICLNNWGNKILFAWLTCTIHVDIYKQDHRNDSDSKG